MSWTVRSPRSLKASSAAVFSDTAVHKLSFLKEAAKMGCNVILCFIGISGPEVSEERVAMRISQGGHEVPSEKLIASFPRALANLKAAIRELPNVFIFDNNDLRIPFQQVALFRNGQPVSLKQPLPKWLRSIID